MQISSFPPALFFLASLLTAYPGPDFVAELETLMPVLQAQTSPASQKLAGMLQNLQAEDISQWQSDYIDLFDRGMAQSPIYETEYGRHRSISKATELADLAGFYQAFGLSNEGQPEMPDHFSMELEFYGFLLLKQSWLEAQGDEEGVEIVTDARKKFLKHHLGAFAQALKGCEAIQNHPLYAAIFDCCAEWVEAECRLLAVQPDALRYFLQEQEPEEMNCSVLGGCASMHTIAPEEISLRTL